LYNCRRYLQHKMLPSEIQLRGCCKPHKIHKKCKPLKCPFLTLKRVLRALKCRKITWQVNPAKLIRAWITPFETEHSKLDTILSHKLIHKTIQALLSAKLNQYWQKVLLQLCSKPFLHQLSLMWLHIKFYKTPLAGVSWLMTKRGFDSWWQCHRLHHPNPCKQRHLQQAWNHILKGSNFLQEPDKIVEPQLPPITHPEWIFFFKTLKNIPGTHEDFASTKDSFIKLLRKSKKKCPLLRPLLRLITIPHLQWQRHTILISFTRKDFASQIYQAIDMKQTSKCHLCYNKDHRESLCPITKNWNNGNVLKHV